VALTTYEPGRVPGERWIELAHRARADDPTWIAPFDEDVVARLSANEAFFERAQARFFVIHRGGRWLARAGASIDPNLSIQGEPAGAIGFFEYEPGAGQAAQEVLCAAADWLCSKGLERIVGPMDYSIWHDYRFKTAGFDRPPFFREPHNPPRYPAAFQEFGFRTLRRYSSVELKVGAELEEIVEEHARFAIRAASRGYVLEDLDPAEVETFLRELHPVIAESFARFEAYTAIPCSEFIAIHKGLGRLVRPGLVCLGRDRERNLLGLLFGLPDYSEALRAMKGQSGLFAKIRFLLAPRPRRAVCLFAGLLPGKTRIGISGAASHRFHKAVLDARYDTLVHALMAEGKEEYWARWQKPELVISRVNYELFSWTP